LPLSGFFAATLCVVAGSTRCRKLLMEKRLLLAAALSLAVLILWEWLVPKPPAHPAPPRVTAASTPARASSGEVPREIQAPETQPQPPPVAATEESVTVLENGLVRASFSNRGALLTSFLLLQYDEQNRPLELVRALPPSAPRPLALDFPGRPDTTERIAQALFAVEKEGNRKVRLRYADGQVAVTKEIQLGAGYLFDLKVSVLGPAYTLSVGTGLRNPTEQERASRYVIPATLVVDVGGQLERLRAEKAQQIAEDERKGKREGRLQWPLGASGFAGFEDNYFLAVLLPRQASEARAFPVIVPEASGKSRPEIAAGVSGSGELDARAYFGPKDVQILEGLNLGLERTVDFGWYGILARPLLWLLRRANAWVGNYGVAILLVTLLIRVLLFPLMHKSYVSMKKMQKLSPKMNAIREKYKKGKSDTAQRQKMNQELMALYQAEGVNPMGGCFPMLLQLPILVAFYNVLSRTIELRHAPFVLWIKDLSAVDGSYVLLILMIASMYVQQAMTPSTADPAQKKIFMAMPLFMGIFFKDMPSGLVLYWFFSNLLSIAQQVIINRIASKDEPVAQKPKRLKQARA
jgi:YidC/Oxa1 family membrane protein insertase